MVNFPSKSVTTPVAVPTRITFAPGNGAPESSVTVPVIELLCAINPCVHSSATSIIELIINLTIFLKFELKSFNKYIVKDVRMPLLGSKSLCKRLHKVCPNE